ncbi:MAG: V-type ATP synthase subunit D [Acholeplasmatales bacterium]|jgi:V/A-type H+-transporting ATPase subunit D|nr:V-type ATP synthase subunit D [Acholeplasmatales bacterium]
MPNIVPTKGNLINLIKQGELAKLGYELMDRKRNVLIHEMVSHIDGVRTLRHELEKVYHQAYLALQDANITLGIVSEIAKSIPLLEDGITLSYKSVMGIELPIVKSNFEPVRVRYGIGQTNTKFDFAYKSFLKVRDLTVRLAEVENSVYRLANAIRKTKKRANALKNIVIPRIEADVKFINDALEEKDREEFIRQKVIKKWKTEG